MGNNVASEGENMDESPRVAMGEISKNKRKHRSYRKRMADKYKSAKAIIPEREFKDEPSKINEAPQDLNRRKNYYKQLGIVKKGSDADRYSKIALGKTVSNIDFMASDSETSTFINKPAINDSHFQSTMIPNEK